MFKNRVTEEAKSVKKACPTPRGYVLQCHLKTTLTDLTTYKHSYTHFQGINVTFKNCICTFTRKFDLF